MASSPTQDQIDSRQKLKDFVEAAGATIRNLGSRAKSAWFSRPDDELKGMIEQGRALSEIQDSMGYRLIMEHLERQIVWLQEQLEVCDEKVMRELRASLKAFRFMRSFILTTERNADLATGVLAGREAAIGNDTVTFVKNARVDA